MKESAGTPLLLATDFDGTLAAVVPSPSDAILRDDARLEVGELPSAHHGDVDPERERLERAPRVVAEDRVARARHDRGERPVEVRREEERRPRRLLHDERRELDRVPGAQAALLCSRLASMPSSSMSAAQ